MDFIKKLSDGSLRNPLTCNGFAKPVEDGREAFLFSLGTSCEDWIRIPSEVIEKVELLGEHSCHDHSHPLIRIHFKEPSANEPLALVLYSLLKALNPKPIQTSRFNPELLLQKEGAKFIGEWMARVFADEVWYSDPPGGERSAPDTHPGINRLCFEARRKCRGQYPFQRLSDEERASWCERMDVYC